MNRADFDDDSPPEASHGAVSTADGLGELIGDACGALARVLNAIHYLTPSELKAHARPLAAVRELVQSLPAPTGREPVGFKSRRRRRA